jgi:hypothetical protein
MRCRIAGYDVVGNSFITLLIIFNFVSHFSFVALLVMIFFTVRGAGEWMRCKTQGVRWAV